MWAEKEEGQQIFWKTKLTSREHIIQQGINCGSKQTSPSELLYGSLLISILMIDYFFEPSV